MKKPSEELDIVVAMFREHGLGCEVVAGGFSVGLDPKGADVICFLDETKIGLCSGATFDLADPNSVPKMVAALKACLKAHSCEGCDFD